MRGEQAKVYPGETILQKNCRVFSLGEKGAFEDRKLQIIEF